MAVVAGTLIDELTACLAGYVEQASLESSGQFTLGGEHALEKLKRFSLAEPRLYVLNAMAAAQSAPSRAIQVKCEADDTILSADTEVDFGPYLQGLSHRLLDDKCPPAVKELAIAYHAAKGLKPDFIEVGTRSKLLHWSPARGESVRNCEGKGIRLQVREKLSLRTMRKYLSYRFGEVRLDTEEDALKRHCNLTSLPTTINGQCLTRPLVLGECRHHLFAGCQDLEDSHPLVRCRHQHGLEKSVRQEPASFPVVLAQDGRLPPYLTLVVRGVNYRLPPLEDRCRAVAYVDHLRKDLSQTQLVHDDEMKRVLAELSQLNRKMCSI